MASFISGLLGTDAGKATTKAAGQNFAAINGMYNLGTSAINTGEGKSAAELDKAIASYTPWVDTGTSANTMYANALGLNGADGNTAATGAFQASPGYQWTLDNAIQGSNRAAAAAGMGASGNALIAAQDRGAQVANQEYGGWLDRLFGVSGQGLDAASGQAQGYTNKGSLYQNTTDQQLGLLSDYTSGLMGTFNQAAKGKEANSAALGELGSSLGNLFSKTKTGSAFLGFL